ncbi:MAG: hypothetical protein NZ524_05135 [Thiobacillaceae bacterium]|nr:hypothetical protein [Thiobacillaceae bacterium]MDW8323667.1 hypothetical protein [Burkholderiales bacterium]
MNPQERRLLQLYRALPASQRASLIDYAEYLASRAPAEDAEQGPKAPLPIPRPAEETVIAAIRRLRRTYPMLDTKDLLHETAGLMTQHVVHKRPAPEVIDELEALFRRAYERSNGGEP